MLLTGLALAALGRPPAARAADFGAKTNGNWSSATTWTPNGVPGSSDTAYIGSTFPNGAASSATVLLTQNQQANTVYLGNGAGTSGTLNLGDSVLTTTNNLYLGYNGGTGTITRGTGSLNIGYSLVLSGSTLAMSANDRTEALFLFDGSTVTTTAVGNITYHVSVISGSTLTLGADLNALAAHGIGGVHVYGDNSTLDAQGHRITATELSLGWYDAGNARLLNRGNLTVESLLVANQNFNLTATDHVTAFRLWNGSTTFIPGGTVYSLNLIYGASATTSATTNIRGEAYVQAGSTLTLGADLNVSQNGPGVVYVYGDNSTLHAQGHTITADTLSLGSGGGSNVQLLNRGNIAVTNLLVANQNFNLTATDQVTNFNLSNGSTTFIPAATVQSLELSNGASATTSAVGNVTWSVGVMSGSTMTMGADLILPGGVGVAGAGTLNAQGHNIYGHSLELNGSSVQLLNRGELSVTYLKLFDHDLNLSAADRVFNLHLFSGNEQRGSIASTAATTNVTGTVIVADNSTLTLGADLVVSGDVGVVGSNSTLDAQGHDITAGSLNLGAAGGTNVRLLNRGNLTVSDLWVGQEFNLTAADRVTNFNLIHNASTNLGAGVSIQRLYVWDEATATTSAVGNITNSVDVINHSATGSRLTLGADLSLSESIFAYGHTITIDAQGHNITASALTVTYVPGGSQNPPNIRLLNDGAITIGGLMALEGVQVELHGGNDSARSLFLWQKSGLRIKSAATGFTITGTTADDLLLIGTSTLTLELEGSQPGWVLRWANPAGGDHIADLNALIAQDMILFSATNGGEYNIVSQNGYTYIVQPVPEPGLILLIAAPVAVGLCRRRLGSKRVINRPTA